MTNEYETTLKAFQDCRATIGIVGLGYVGIPLAEAIIEKGFSVIGLDVDAEKVRHLKAGESYLHHIENARIKAMRASGRFEAETDFSKVGGCDAVIICVPTPLGRHHEPLLDFIKSAGAEIAPYLNKGQLVVLESSTFPGTTSEELRPILEERGLVAGQDFYLAFSPEREDPGRKDFTTATTPKIVGGAGPEAQKLVETLYGKFIDTIVPVSSPEVAEAAKLLENIFREINIGLVNELKAVFDAMGIDIWEVIDAAKTKPFGFMPFYPGAGVGGHCIPLDPYYLTWKAQEKDMATHFITLAGEVNEHMPHYVVEKTAQGLDRYFKKGLNGINVLIAGVAYKKNIDDYRESPSLKIADLLKQRGAIVSYHDQFIPALPDNPHSGALAGMKSVALTPETLAAFDAVIIATAHDDVDYRLLADHSDLVVDTCNVTHALGEMKCKLVKA